MPAVIGKGRQIPFGLTRGTSEQLSAIASEHVRASVLLPYSSQRNESLCASKAPASAFHLFPEKLNYHSSLHENLEKFQFKACKGAFKWRNKNQSKEQLRSAAVGRQQGCTSVFWMLFKPPT
jgi:hypothetical protein